VVNATHLGGEVGVGGIGGHGVGEDLGLGLIGI
jgi:hypothetical protein